MKKLLLLTIILCPLLAFSQRKKDCRSAIDFIVSPEYFSPPQTEANINLKPQLGFRVGTNVNLYSSAIPHFVFRSGFRYAQFSYNIDSVLTQKAAYETYRFVEIPLVFRYYWGLKTWRFYTEIQSSLNFNFTKKNTVDRHISAGGAVGLEYIKNRNLAFFTQPTFRKRILPDFGDKSINYDFSLGLEMGVKYRY